LQEHEGEDRADRQTGECQQGRTDREGRVDAGEGGTGRQAVGADRKKVAPSIWASCGPNMLTAESKGDAVARYTRVASARPLMVRAAFWAAKERKNGVYSGVRKSSR
jgi:hypothetical protein